MSILGDGATTTLVLLLISLLAHEPWRWLGLALGRDIDVEGELFDWVRAVATALVAGLVMRLLLFPAGALADLPLALRCVAFVVGIGVFMSTGRHLTLGIAGGTLALLAGGWAIG